MKLAVICDTHAGIKSDAPFMLDYQEKFYKDIFFPYLLKNDIKTLWHLGDLFDRRKYINFQTLHRTREMFLDRLEEYGITMYIIPGNHDVALKNTNSVNALQTLLQEYKNIKIIFEPSTLFFDNTPVMFIPWINPENSQECLGHLEDNSQNAKLVCGHFEIEGFEMYRGIKNQHGMPSELFGKYEQIFSGHFHLKSKQGNIQYLGAPFEYTWADYNENKGFHIYDTTEKTLDFIQNPYKLYEKIYYDDSMEDYNVHEVEQYENKIVQLIVNNKTKPAVYDNFIERLFTVNMVDFKILETLVSDENVEDVSVDELKTQSTKTIIENYIDEIETDLSREKMKSIFSGLYVEALHQ
jgi:DNA repair exonuclease SbcCD nuclease subunit